MELQKVYLGQNTLKEIIKGAFNSVTFKIIQFTKQLFHLLLLFGDKPDLKLRTRSPRLWLIHFDIILFTLQGMWNTWLPYHRTDSSRFWFIRSAPEYIRPDTEWVLWNNFILQPMSSQINATTKKEIKYLQQSVSKL